MLKYNYNLSLKDISEKFISIKTLFNLININ